MWLLEMFGQDLPDSLAQERLSRSLHKKPEGCTKGRPGEGAYCAKAGSAAGDRRHGGTAVLLGFA